MKRQKKRTRKGTPRTIHIGLIRGCPVLKPRKQLGDVAELADSIRRQGVQNPLVARPNPVRGGYDLVCGYRRLEAAKEAGLDRVPVEVRGLSDAASLALSFADNVDDRQTPLSPMDEARVFHRLKRMRKSTREVALLCRRSPQTVRKSLRLLKAPKRVRDMLEKGQTSKMAAVAVADLSSPVQEAVLPYITPGTTEARVKRLANAVVHRDKSGRKRALARIGTRKGGDPAARRVAVWPAKRTVRSYIKDTVVRIRETERLTGRKNGPLRERLAGLLAAAGEIGKPSSSTREYRNVLSSLMRRLA